MSKEMNQPAAGLTDAAGRGANRAPSTSKVPISPTTADRGGNQSETPNSPYDDASNDQFNAWMLAALAAAPSWLVSMVFHVVLLLILALWAVGTEHRSNAPVLVAQVQQEEVYEEDFDLKEILPIPPEPPELETEDVSFEEVLDFADASEMEIEPSLVEITPGIGIKKMEIGENMLDIIGGHGNNPTGGLGGWRNPGRRPPVSPVIIKAVNGSLGWLAEHQMRDGGWSFNHAACRRCGGQCRNPGSAAVARAGATGMAILPFLGAGQTHREGEYKNTIRNGLYFLVNRMKFDPRRGGSFHEPAGRMYSHGLAAIALCEAYAMTHDRQLHNPAQAAINFIVYAQAADGGWRYEPKQNGDTSVVGWQLMALKSGHLAYLRVPPGVVEGASRFFDKVQALDGAAYGYTSPAAGRQATTSIGLLCRMYLGWEKDRPALQAGADQLAAWGPRDDVYYNYYASQALMQLGGDRWEKFDEAMRKQLLDSQAKEGHETGSWFSKTAAGHGNDRGGRLYHTAMNTMTLEVKFRNLPIYHNDAVDIPFEE